MVDIGSSSVRAGYAGDDTPKGIIPTYYGYKHTASVDAEGDMSMGETGEDAGVVSKPGNATVYLGQHGPSIWREGMEIANPMREGLSTSFPFCVRYLRAYIYYNLLQYPTSLPFLNLSAMP